MKKMKLIIALTMGVTVLAISCKKSDNANPGTPFMETDHDTISATINGSFVRMYVYSFTIIDDTKTASYFEVSGQDSLGDRILGLYASGVSLTSTGTYNLNTTGADSCRYRHFGVKHIGVGSFKVVAVSDSFVQGTFSVTADSFNITNGVFNYKR